MVIIMNIKLKSGLTLLIAAIIWGFAFVAQRVGADYVGTFTFNGIRFLLGACSLLPVILIFEKKKVAKEELKILLIYSLVAGVALFAASSLQQYGIFLTGSAGKASFITGLYTVLVPVCALFMHKRVGMFTWIGVALSVTGLYHICMNGTEGISAGDIVLMVGTLFWTFHIIIVDYVTKRVPPIKFAMGQFFVCGIISLLCALIFEDITVSGISKAIIPILYGGFMSVGVAYTCQIVGQKNAEPTWSAIILSTESVFGAIGGALILHETMPLRGYIGCVLIFAGIIFAQLRTRSEHILDSSVKDKSQIL